jgi:hypothetical protein
MWKSKQDKTENRDSMPEHPRQMLEIIAKLDEIDRKLGAWADNVKRFDQKLATVIEKWNQSAKANTIGFEWAQDIKRKLDILIERWSQPVQPVQPMPQITALNTAPDEITTDAAETKLSAADATPIVTEPAEFDRRGRRKKIFYVNDPLGFVERRIDSLTADNKTATCVFLSSLFRLVNVNTHDRRKRITAAKLVEHLLELMTEKRVVAFKSTRTPDIGFRLGSSTKRVAAHFSRITIAEAMGMMKLFTRWNRNA